MSNDTIIVSLLTIFIVKNSRYIVRLSGKLSGMDDNSLNTLFHNARKEDKSGRWEAALSVRPGS
jgi:hypothetical protein